MPSIPLSVSRYSPASEKDILSTLAWTSSVCSVAPVARSHSLTALSSDVQPLSNADASSLLSGENAMAVAAPPWPSSVCNVAPVAGFHSLTMLSSDVRLSSDVQLPPDADASSLPSGENATAMTGRLWPSSVCSATPVAGSHSLTVLCQTWKMLNCLSI
jgi:hypothetical protein